MIRLLKATFVPCIVEGQSVDMAVMTLCGLADDEKPTEMFRGILIANGSKFITIGGSSYTYDEENQTWVQDAGGSGSGSGSSGGGEDLAAQILQIIALAMGNTPITRIEIEDEADTALAIESWDTEYVIPGTSLETLTITLPETTPTALSSCIKVTILGITRHADPEDDSEDPLLLPPTIILPEGLYIIGGYPEFDGDRWCLTIDNDMTATAMVIPAPVVEEEEEEQNGGS